MKQSANEFEHRVYAADLVHGPRHYLVLVAHASLVSFLLLGNDKPDQPLGPLRQLVACRHFRSLLSRGQQVDSWRRRLALVAFAACGASTSTEARRDPTLDPSHGGERANLLQLATRYRKSLPTALAWRHFSPFFVDSQCPVDFPVVRIQYLWIARRARQRPIDMSTTSAKTIAMMTTPATAGMISATET